MHMLHQDFGRLSERVNARRAASSSHNPPTDQQHPVLFSSASEGPASHPTGSEHLASGAGHFKRRSHTGWLEGDQHAWSLNAQAYPGSGGGSSGDDSSSESESVGGSSGNDSGDEKDESSSCSSDSGKEEGVSCSGRSSRKGDGKSRRESNSSGSSKEDSGSGHVLQRMEQRPGRLASMNLEASSPCKKGTAEHGGVKSSGKAGREVGTGVERLPGEIGKRVADNGVGPSPATEQQGDKERLMKKQERKAKGRRNLRLPSPPRRSKGGELVCVWVHESVSV